MNTHNNTKYRTAVGTFQLKYHKNGGKVGSYGVKMPSEFNNDPKGCWIQ